MILRSVLLMLMISLTTGGKFKQSFGHCSEMDCSRDASCLYCSFPPDCRLDEDIIVNCTARNECIPNTFSTTRETKCRYCWQSDADDMDCIASGNCSTTSSQLIVAECTVHSTVICLGSRTFPKKVRCNWSSGLSWAKTLFLSITLGGFGADRFYLGLWKSAIGKLFSFGGLGIWTVVDVVLVATGYLRPADGSMYI